ncbi:MAG: hypothetical protein ACK54P_06810, partial [Bacteroidota bacterium]
AAEGELLRSARLRAAFGRGRPGLMPDESQPGRTGPSAASPHGLASERSPETTSRAEKADSLSSGD